VKQSLRLIPIFIILFLLIYALFSAFAFVYEWLLAAPHNLGAAFDLAVTLLPTILLDVLPPALIFSLFLLLFFRRSQRGKSLLASLLVLVIASALYGGLFYYLSGIDAPAGTQRPFPPLAERRLQRMGEHILYTEELRSVGGGSAAQSSNEGAQEPGMQNAPRFTLQPLLDVSLNREAPPHMRLLPGGIVRPAEQRITLADTGESIAYGAVDVTGIRDIQPPPLLRGFLREIGRVAAHLRQLLERSLLLFAIAIGAQVLWSVSAWGLVRVSSWPVFNALLALLAFRGLFFLWETFRSDIIVSTLSPLLPARFLPVIPAGALVLIAVLMLAWSSLIRPEKGAD
jgi:hypothetical protein